jgi:hypothetical protein
MHFHQWKRREFITLLGSAAAAWPLSASAQQPGKLPTIGFLGTPTAPAWSKFIAAFEQRLRELGWIEGRTVAIEYRWGEGRRERFAEFAAEFVRLKVDVIVTGGSAVSAVLSFSGFDPKVTCDTHGSQARCYLRSRLVPRTRSSRTSCSKSDRELRVQKGH